MRQALRAAAASPVHYERRRPEETTLYRLVQEHLETFLAEVEAGGAASLPALTGEKLQALLGKIITRILRLLTRQGHLVEEEGVTYVADAQGTIDPDNLLAPLQAASCTYRIALGPRAGRKVLSLQYVASRAAPITQPLCANAHGFSLHAGVRCASIFFRRLDSKIRTGFGQSRSRWLGSACARASEPIEGNRTPRRVAFLGKQRGLSECSCGLTVR